MKSKKWNDEITAKQISLKEFAVIEKSIQDKISSFNEAEISRKIKLTEKEIQELKETGDILRKTPKTPTRPKNKELETAKNLLKDSISRVYFKGIADTLVRGI